MKIKKLYLQTLYLQAVKKFYSSTLELPVEVKNENSIVIKIGSSELVFRESKDMEAYYHFAVNIPANKIDEAKVWLAARVKLLWMKDYNSDIANFINWHALSVYFYDPAGNILELIARFDLKNESDDNFSSKHFLSLNEVGLVYPHHDFDQKISELRSSFSLPYFDKQPPLPQFRAVGDDEGLFVAVPEHRNWYPTDKPSRMFPMKIEFQVNGRNHLLEL